MILLPRENNKERRIKTFGSFKEVSQTILILTPKKKFKESQAKVIVEKKEVKACEMVEQVYQKYIMLHSSK
jgi:hypothetical protein